jgi:inosose dehydratase
MKVEIGTCPDSWGVWFAQDPRQTPWQRFLNEVAEAGYEWIELGPFGYLPTDPATLRRELEARGLRLSAAMVMRPLEDASLSPELPEETERVGELVASLGGGYVVLIDDVYRDLKTGAALAPAKLDDDSWKRLVETSNELGRLAKERSGMQLVFHSHADSHVEYLNQIEAFIAQTDPAFVGILLDFGHCEYRGVDSLALLRRYRERIPYLHLKMVDPEVRDRVAKEDPPFGTAVSWGIFAEAGTGVPELTELVRALEEVDYQGLAIVEQDLYPCDFGTPLPIAKRVRTRLREAGLG